MELFFLIVGCIVGPLAGLIAFLITLDEWSRHRFTGRKRWVEPLRRGVATALFFVALSLVIGAVLIKTTS